MEMCEVVEGGGVTCFWSVILMAFHNQVLMKTTVDAGYRVRRWWSGSREPGGPSGPWVAVDGYRSSLAHRTVLTRRADGFRRWE